MVWLNTDPWKKLNRHRRVMICQSRPNHRAINNVNNNQTKPSRSSSGQSSWQNKPMMSVICHMWNESIEWFSIWQKSPTTTFYKSKNVTHRLETRIWNDWHVDKSKYKWMTHSRWNSREKLMFYQSLYRQIRKQVLNNVNFRRLLLRRLLGIEDNSTLCVIL